MMLKKAESHLYTVIKVARGEDLRKQIGKNIYFDLVDHDKVRSFQILKQSPFNLFKEEFAKALGIPVESQCFWIWSKRQNQSYRPHRRLRPEEEAKNVGELTEVFDKNNSELKLFLELECRQDYHLPPPIKGEKDILLFFKLYDLEKEELRYVGRLFVKSFDKPIEILRKLNALAGFAWDEEIELFEEIRFEPKVVCKRLDMMASFESSEIGDGDIICFQKRLTPQIEEQVTFPSVFSFLKHVKSRQLLEAEKSLAEDPQQRAKVINVVAAKNQAAENQVVVKPREPYLTWKIKNFSHLNVKTHNSDSFYLGGDIGGWKLQIYPKGDDVDFLSLYLLHAGYLTENCSNYAKFSIAVVNQIDSEKTITKEYLHVFTAKEKRHGCPDLIPLRELTDPNKGFVVNDTIIIQADIALSDSIQKRS